ncbi:hypothetical protein LY78DRAFT_686464 [Colletotrichum sublineola]|nr:hypothetical protein LY78DRAFT_686464 [Colletotrichum sublineola]
MTNQAAPNQKAKAKRPGTKFPGLPDRADDDDAHETGKIKLTTNVLLKMTKIKDFFPKPADSLPTDLPPTSAKLSPVHLDITTTPSAPETTTNLSQKQETSRALALETFNPGGWLGDEVIEKVMGYLVSRNPGYCHVSSLAFAVMANNPEPPPWAPRRFAGLRAMHDTVLFPVNMGGVHWVLAQYSFTLESQLAAVIKAIWGAETPCVSRVELSAEQQPNAYDCGLYVLYHTDLLTRRPNDPLPRSLSSADLRSYYRQVFMME